MRESRGGKIFHTLAGPEARKRHRCVEVIKHVQRPRRGVENKICCRVGIRTVRGDDCDIRVAEVASRDGYDTCPISVEHQLRVLKRLEIAMRGIVVHVALEENHIMAAQSQRRNETAPERRMAITPG